MHCSIALMTVATVPRYCPGLARQSARSSPGKASFMSPRPLGVLSPWCRWTDRWGRQERRSLAVGPSCVIGQEDVLHAIVERGILSEAAHDCRHTALHHPIEA